MLSNNKKSFWEKKWGNNAICGITMTRLRPGKYKKSYKRCIHLECGHGFYTRPLLEWLNNKNNCPMCRGNVNIKELFKKMF